MQPVTFWLTGLSGAGKSTLAHRLTVGLHRSGIGDLTLLDGEAVRARLPRPYGHGLEERAAVLRIIVEMAREETATGRHVVVATISHQRWMREYAMARLSPLMEIFLDCSPAVCAARDDKGHYRRALNGEYNCFIGVTHSYERPENPHLIIDTATETIDQSSRRLLRTALDFLDQLKKLLPA